MGITNNTNKVIKVNVKNILARVYLDEAYQFNISKVFGETLKKMKWEDKEQVYVYMDGENVVFTKNLDVALKKSPRGWYEHLRQNHYKEIVGVPG